MNEAAQSLLGPHLSRLLTPAERRELSGWVEDLPEQGGELALLCRNSTFRASFWASFPDGLEGRALISVGVSPAASDAIQLRRLEQAVEGREIGIYEHDHVIDQVYASEATREHYGLGDKVDLQVPDFTACVVEADRESFVAAVAAAHSPTGNGRFDHTNRSWGPDGQMRWVHSVGWSYFGEGEDGERRVLRTVGSTKDVTDEVLVQNRQRRLSAALESSPDVVALARRDGTLLYANASGRKSLGLAPGQSVDALRICDLLPSSGIEQLVQALLPGLEENGVWEGDLDLRGPDGVIPCSVVLQLHPADLPWLESFISVQARDLSEKLELEAQLLHSQKLEAVGRLAGGVAHDFNNLLSVIQSSLYLLREDGPDAPTADEYLEDIHRAAESAGRLTSELLAFSRRQVLRPRPLDLNESVSKLERIASRLLGADVDLRVELGELGALTRVDPGRLEQVVLNLLINARDAMPDGGVVVLETQRVILDEEYARTHSEVVPGPYLLLTVSDNGVGMDAETQRHIFEPFFTTKAVGRGTGLGLATVFGIVRQSGGHIWVYSEPGRGSSFKIYLPVHAEGAGDAIEAEPVQPRPSAGERVLVVEDDPGLRRLVVEVLGRGGYRPIAANGPLEALAIVRSGVPVDLVLTDVVMPQMSGKDMIDALAAEGHALKALYVSGYTENTVVHHGVLQAGTHFLSKPFAPVQLLEAVGIALAAEGAGAG